MTTTQRSTTSGAADQARPRDRWRICGHALDIEADDRGCTCTSYGPTPAELAAAVQRIELEARATERRAA